MAASSFFLSIDECKGLKLVRALAFSLDIPEATVYSSMIQILG